MNKTTLKDLFAVLCCLLPLLLCGCGGSEKVLRGKDVGLIKDEEISCAEITSHDGKCDYKFTNEESVKKIYDYFCDIRVYDNFTEDPERYIASGYRVTLKYGDGTESTIIHFGNLFVREVNAKWYKMNVPDGAAFEETLASAIPGCSEFETMKSGTYSMVFEENRGVQAEYSLISFKDGAFVYASSDEKGNVTDSEYFLFTREGQYSVDADKKTYEKNVDTWFDDDFFDAVSFDNDYKCVKYTENGDKREYKYQKGGRHIDLSFESGNLTGISLNIFGYGDTEIKPISFSASVPDRLFFKITGGLKDVTVDRLKEETPGYFEITSGKLSLFACRYWANEFAFVIADGEKTPTLKELDKLTLLRLEHVKLILEHQYPDIAKENIRIIPFKGEFYIEDDPDYGIEKAVDDLKKTFGEGYSYATDFYNPES